MGGTPCAGNALVIAAEKVVFKKHDNSKTSKTHADTKIERRADV